MLEEVRIRSLGVITDATLELSPGLTVITGETGAGKTMVVTGLGLLLGARADAGAVRRGAGAALVEGRFSVDAEGPVAQRAAEAGAELDDGALLVARSVAAGGRGRAHLGGRAVPVAVLADLADDLVAVHGQSEQVLLRSPARQREALDRYAGDAVAVPMAGYARTWERWGRARAAADRLAREAAERRAEAELLRLGLAEVERVAPQPGEDAALAEEAERLEHAEELRAAAELAHTALAGDEAAGGPAADAVTALHAARRALEHARDHDPRLGELADRVGEVGYLVADIAADLAGYTAGTEVDPARLQAVQTRRAALTALARTRGGPGASIDEVLAWAGRAGPRLLELEGDDDRVAALREEQEVLGAQLVALAGELSAARTRAAAALGEAASAELPGLSMPHTRLVVAVSTPQVRAAEDLGPHGADEVVLMLEAPGSERRPLARGASGGELSRVMLALELVLGAGGEVPTFVFDEVDAGVGGRAAVGVGRRLARLARDRQVVVVTHLPQVAAFADAHVRVAKAVRAGGDGAPGGDGAGPGEEGAVTVSGVEVLDGEERVGELARMLAGQEDSATARAHAAELLALAADAARDGHAGGAAGPGRGRRSGRAERPGTGGGRESIAAR